MTQQQWDEYVAICTRLGEPVALTPPEGIQEEKLYAFDKASADTRFVLTKSQIIELVKTCIEEEVEI